MADAGVRFGTSGARGRVEGLSDALCYALTAAFVQYVRASPGGGDGLRVAVAGDRRASTERIMAACMGAVADLGATPMHCGRIPTPALAAFALREGIPGIMVTGSHIPEDRNGIKLYLASGEILKTDEEAISQQSVTVPETVKPVSAPVDPRACDQYVARLVEAFGPGALSGVRVGAYGHSAVGRELTATVLQQLGASVTPLGYSESFVAVDTEAIRPEDHALARAWASDGDYDALVTTDGDGDRPMLADAAGQWLRGDVVGILAAADLGASVVVTPVSSNTAAERSRLFDRVVRTRIGSPFVVQAMQEAEREDPQAVVVGYEANGGLLQHSPVALGERTLSPLPTRDALVVIIALLRQVAGTRRTLAELVATLPPRFTASDRLKGVERERTDAWIAAQVEASSLGATLGPSLGEVRSVDSTDGIRLTYAAGEIIHVRPSGNAPEVRCYCEADTQGRATSLVAETLARLAAALG